MDVQIISNLGATYALGCIAPIYMFTGGVACFYGGGEAIGAAELQR